MRLRITRLIVCFVVGLVIYLTYHYTYHGDVVENEDFNRTVLLDAFQQLCSDYNEGLISGDLCNRLCFHTNVSAKDIEGVREGPNSKLTILLKSGGQQLVLKADSLYAPQNRELPDGILNGDEKVFLSRLLEAVNFHLALDWPMKRSRYLLEMLWPSYQRTYFNLTQADRRSLWSLVSQDEYVTITVLKTAQIFPTLMGTCGHFYATDYVKPFQLDSYFYGTVRGKVLMHVSATLKLMYSFINEPLHWCDVRLESMGLGSEYPKRFIIIDADFVFTESRMQALLLGLRCRSDEECRFYDCTAKCDKRLQRCSHRTNDNIEVFCRKIVYELYGNFWSRNNKFLEICHTLDTVNSSDRIQQMHAYWTWSITDV